MSDDWAVSITIAGGKAYDAPKITAHGDNAEEAWDRIKAVSDPEFLEAVVNGGSDFIAAWSAAQGLGKVEISQQANDPGKEWDPKGRKCSKCDEPLYIIRGEKNGRKWVAAGHEGGGFGHDRFFDVGK